MNAALNNNIRIFTGNSVPELAHKICDHLSLPLGQALVSTFSDGEIRVEIVDNVRGRDVFLIQSTCPPTNHNLMELLLMIDAVKRASARRITAVIPYFGYARQDRKVAPRTPITSKLVADLIQSGKPWKLGLVDIDPEALQVAAGLTKRMVQAKGAAIEIESLPPSMAMPSVIIRSRIATAASSATRYAVSLPPAIVTKPLGLTTISSFRDISEGFLPAS